MSTSTDSRLAGLTGRQRAALVQVVRGQRQRQSTDTDHDVVIVGGGVAGLTLALQLVQSRPGTAVAVLEKQQHPVPEVTHKVGESTVEIAAHYLRDILGLRDHLESEQIRKFGLRMFFSNHDNTDITRRVELGSSVFPPLSTYQLDRGRLENELGERCRRAGVTFLSGARVVDVDLGPEGPHTVSLQIDGETRQLTTRWLIDSSGRSQLLRRRLGAPRRPGSHHANAAWFRVGHPIDIGTWTDDPEWHGRVAQGDKALSTNHLMGPGYWVWLIRLASGSTSIGIVAEATAHDFAGFNTLDKALAWLAVREPQCAAAIEKHRDEIQDFRVMRDYSYGCDRVYAGDQRWCLTGESGLFLDPLYSPGLDLIAISNGLVTDLVARSLDGEDVTAVAVVHDKLFRTIADIWLGIYADQYRLMGHARVMSSKVIWDTAFYWGVFGLLFFHDKFRSMASSPAIAGHLSRLTAISNRVQQFFREWADLGHCELPARFVDLYAPLDFMIALHAGMDDRLSEEQLKARFAGNVRLFEQLAGQLVSAVIEKMSDRTDDAAVAGIQAWQRDPLITQFLTTYWRERRAHPTSSGWIVLDNPVSDERPAPAPALINHHQKGWLPDEQRTADVATYAG